MSDHDEQIETTAIDGSTGATRRRRRIRSIVASIVAPPVVFLVIGLMQRALSVSVSPWEMFIGLGIGFAFLLREFKLLAVLLCWAYFIPMYWFTLRVVLYFVAIVLRSPP